MSDTRGTGPTGRSGGPARSPLARAPAEQRERWRSGERVLVEACLEQAPALRASAGGAST